MSRGIQGEKLAVRWRTNSTERPLFLSVSSLKPPPHARAATHAPLRVNDYQIALGFESANLRKNRGRQRWRSALRLLSFRRWVRSRHRVAEPSREELWTTVLTCRFSRRVLGTLVSLNCYATHRLLVW